jgi:hypothetical protein
MYSIPDTIAEEAKSLVAEGWTLLPCDSPERGLRGFVVFKGEVTKELFWPLYGKELVPEVERVSPVELAAFLLEGPVSLCDDPRALRLGFVRYEPEQGRAKVRQVTLSDFKRSDSETQDLIQKVRETLLSESKEMLSHLHDLLSSIATV